MPTVIGVISVGEIRKMELMNEMIERGYIDADTADLLKDTDLIDIERADAEELCLYE